MAEKHGVQVDMFGHKADEVAQDSVPPVMTAQSWQMAETPLFVAALKRRSLVDSLAVLNHLKIDVAWKVLLETGFTVGSTTSREALMGSIQEQIIEAVQRGMTGHELRAAKAEELITTSESLAASPGAMTDLAVGFKTPSHQADMEQLVKVAANSIEELREVDVLRVLESNDRSSALARYIAEKRPDLAQEIGEVMEDEFGVTDWKGEEIEGTALDYPAFKAKYQELFDRMMSYSPKEVGSGIYTEKLAELSDTYPEFSARIDAEAEVTSKEPWQMTLAEWKKYHFDENEHIGLPGDYFDSHEFNASKSKTNLIAKTESGIEIRMGDYGIAYAFHGDRNVGMGDGKAFVVHPDYQKQGIGTALLEATYTGRPIGSRTAAGQALVNGFHKKSVQATIREGKPVSANVLADYPEFGVVEMKKEPWQMTLAEFKAANPALQGKTPHMLHVNAVAGAVADGNLSLEDAIKIYSTIESHPVVRYAQKQAQIATAEVSARKPPVGVYASMENFKPAEYRMDIPTDSWLKAKLQDVEADGRNEFGVPKYMGPITGWFDRPLNLPVAMLAGVPGECDEQNHVRQESLQYIRDNWNAVSKHAAYIEVDPYGKAWVSEGNHRIMVAAERGESHFPVEVKYFTGGQYKTSDFSAEKLMAMDVSRGDLMKDVGKADSNFDELALVNRLKLRYEALRSMTRDVPDNYKQAGIDLEKGEGITKAIKAGVVVGEVSGRFGRKAFVQSLIKGIQTDAEVVVDLLENKFKALVVPDSYDLRMDKKDAIRWIESNASNNFSVFMGLKPFPGSEHDTNQIDAEIRVFLDRPSAHLFMKKGKRFYLENHDLLRNDESRFVKAETYSMLGANVVETFNSVMKEEMEKMHMKEAPASIVWNRESIAARYAEALAEVRGGADKQPKDFHFSFADAILEKKAYALDYLANGLNETGKKVFSEVTGVALPKQQGATWDTLREWGGIDRDEDIKNRLWRKVANEREKLRDKGAAPDVFEGVDQHILDGFREIKSINRKNYLAKGEVGFDLSKRGSHSNLLIPYLKARIAYENHLDLMQSREKVSDDVGDALVTKKAEGEKVVESRMGVDAKVVGLDSDRAIRAMGVANITDVGEENVYLEKDGQQFYFKPGNNSRFAVGQHDFSREVVFGEDIDYFAEFKKCMTHIGFVDDGGETLGKFGLPFLHDGNIVAHAWCYPVEYRDERLSITVRGQVQEGTTTLQKKFYFDSPQTFMGALEKAENYALKRIDEAMKTLDAGVTIPVDMRSMHGVTDVEKSVNPADELRTIWNEQGVPVEKQEALLAEIADKASPGASVGPFKVADSKEGVSTALNAPLPSMGEYEDVALEKARKTLLVYARDGCQSARKFDHPTASNFDQGFKLISCAV